jgi:hypothetical protein
MSGLINVGCYECGTTFAVTELEHYNSRRLCANCSTERRARWERLTGTSGHEHAWEPMAPEDGPFDMCRGCNTARRRS